MPVQDKYLKRDKAQIPVPQYFDNDLDDFVPLDNGMYIKEAQVMIPTEQQAKYAETRQTHTGVSVLATTGTNTSSYQDISGFTEVVLTFVNSAQAACQVDLLWSHDGTTPVTTETALASTARTSGLYRTKRAARYVAVKLSNTDGTARTMSSWLDLTV